MLFSSRLPFNDDPQPWRAQDFTGRAYDHRVADENGMPASAERLRMGYVHDPRPGFDRPQHNPTNSILVQTRSDISLAPGAAAEIIAAQVDLLNSGDDYWNLDVVTTEHIDHARRVLSRLLVDDDPDDPCGECGEEIDPLDMHADYGMCGSCVHNAVRSGWDPSEPEAA